MGDGYNKIKEPPPNARPSILSVCTRVYKLWIYPGLGFSICSIYQAIPVPLLVPIRCSHTVVANIYATFFFLLSCKLTFACAILLKSHHPWSQMLDNPCIYIMIELSKKIVKIIIPFCLISLHIHNDRIVHKNSKNNYSFLEL